MCSSARWPSGSTRRWAGERWPGSSPPRGPAPGAARDQRAGRWGSARPGSTSGATATPRRGGPGARSWRSTIRRMFAAHRGTLRFAADHRRSAEAGWRVSENTVAKIMREQRLVARPASGAAATTRPGRGRWRAPDLIGRDFPAGAGESASGTATAPRSSPTRASSTWQSVLDMGSRRIVGFALREHHDAELAYAALAMAVAVRGGREAVAGVILHTDQGSEYTATDLPDRLRPAWASTSRWAGPGRPWTTRSSNRGTPRWSSSYAAASTSPPRRHARARGRGLDRGVQPRPAPLGAAACAARSPTNSAARTADDRTASRRHDDARPPAPEHGAVLAGRLR